MSAATINHHLRAVKSFCGWLVNERRISENPLANISLLNAQADRRVERHPYSVEELGLLLAAAGAGGILHGMTGPDRALLYRTAVETGFRWSECRSLTRASFNFESEPATVTIRAEDAKNGKEETLPLRPELAADLKARMAMFLPAAKTFSGMWAGKGAACRIDTALSYCFPTTILRFSLYLMPRKYHQVMLVVGSNLQHQPDLTLR